MGVISQKAGLGFDLAGLFLILRAEEIGLYHKAPMVATLEFDTRYKECIPGAQINPEGQPRIDLAVVVVEGKKPGEIRRKPLGGRAVTDQINEIVGALEPGDPGIEELHRKERWLIGLQMGRKPQLFIEP